MNKFFRVVWSHTRNAYVVAGEHACTRSKHSGGFRLAGGLAFGLLATTAHAVSTCPGPTTTIGTTTTSICTLQAGHSLIITDTGSLNSAGSPAVISNAGFGTISNAGMINGHDTAILLQTGSGPVSGDSITNMKDASILGSEFGLHINGGAHNFTIENIDNRGSIEGLNSIGVQIENATLSELLKNSGTISGGGYAIQLSNSEINAIENSGKLDGYIGIAADTSTIGTINNTGFIDTFGGGVTAGNSKIDEINNSGTITASYSIYISYHSTLNTIHNSGTINGNIYALDNSSIGRIENRGTAASISAIHLSTIQTINNIGTIKSDYTGIRVEDDSTVSVINNAGVIEGRHSAVFAIDTDGGAIDSINVIGTRARIIGDVYAISANFTVNSGAIFSSENAYGVDRFVIENDATLKIGSGTSSSGMLNDGITVLSGFSNAGTLNLAAGTTGTIHGDYTQASTGALKIGVTSDSAYGKLVVDGAATLTSNAKLVVDVSNFKYAFNAHSLLDVLSATTLVSDGTFAISDNSALFNFDAVKDGNTVDLTLAKGASVLGRVISPDKNPARNAAQVLDNVLSADPTSELASNFVTLTSDQEVSDAVTSTLPTVAGNANNATSNTLTGINHVIQTRQGENSGLSSGDAPLSEGNLWIKTFGSWAEQDERSGISGYDADTQGLAIGADTAVSDSTRLGLAFAYAQTDLNNNSRVAPQDAQIDTFQLIGYGSYALSADTELNFQLDAGQNRTDGKRYMPFADATAKAGYDGYNVHAGLGIGHNMRLSEQLTFVPSARADYTWISTDAYHEKGAGALNLDVDSNDSEELLLSIDGKLNYSLSEATVISANIGAGYDVIDEDSAITSTYAGAPGAAFRTPGMDMEPWLARAGLGLTHTLAGGTEVSLRYDAEARSDFTNQGASLKARWAF
jgi:outer membrane autotransporter protein